MAYGDFKGLNRTVFSDKAFNTAKNVKYDEYVRGLASMVYKCFDKNLLVAVLKINIFVIKN